MKQLTSATYWHSEAEDDMIYSSRGTSVEKARWWHRSYIFDYLLVCFNFGMVGILYFFVPPFQRYLPPSNSTDAILYPYPYEGDTVPSWSLVWRQKKMLLSTFSQLIFPGLLKSIIGFVGPILCFLVLQFWRRSAHDFHTTVLGLLEAQSLTLLATEAIKLAAGEYRPDYISIIDEGKPEKLIKDAQQSFPSGHSSLSFCAMCYMAMWLMANLGAFHKKGSGEFWRSMLSMVPLIVAIFVAISRVDDYRHDFDDITVGAMIGAAFGVYCWLLNYPPPTSNSSAIPKHRGVKEFMVISDEELLLNDN